MLGRVPNTPLLWIRRFFISNARLKLAKFQANTKQHCEAELLPFENYSHSSSTLSSKNNWHIWASMSVFIRLIIMKMKMEIKKKNRSHRYDINRPTIIFIIFWDFLTFYQIFFSPQVKRCACITCKHGIHELPNDLRLTILGN